MPPIIKGKADFNPPKPLVLLVPHIFRYGRFLQSLSEIATSFPEVQIVSGLDKYRHLCNTGIIKEWLSTIAVLAHGLDRIYPVFTDKLR